MEEDGAFRMSSRRTHDWRATRDYPSAVAKRKQRGCESAPAPDLLLAQLRSPDEQTRVKGLHSICPCAARFLLYEHFRGEAIRLHKPPASGHQVLAAHLTHPFPEA